MHALRRPALKVLNAVENKPAARRLRTSCRQLGLPCRRTCISARTPMGLPSKLILVHKAADNSEIARFYAPKRAEVVLQRLLVVGQLKTEDGVVLADGDVLEAGTYKFYDAPGFTAAAPGPPFNALDIIHRSYPAWQVEACSESTTGRAYPELQMGPWDIDSTKVKQYLQQKLGSLQLAQDPTAGPLEVTPLKSSADCNSSFKVHYGAPVAYIPTQLQQGGLSFHLNPPTVSATGEPNFMFYLNGVIELMAGEGKTPSALKSAATMFPTRSDPRLQSCARQICDYIQGKGRRYGWLTYLNGTFFVKRSKKGPHMYCFSRALPCRLVDITVLEMLTYVVLKQLEKGKWPALPAEQPSVAVSQGHDQQDIQIGPSTSNTHSVTRCQAAAAQQQGRGAVSSFGGLRSHAEYALQISSRRLGSGQCGVVIEARCHGEPAAIKAIDLSKRGKLAELLINEFNTYEHLRPLQGECIPILKGFGLWHNDSTLFLAMSVAEGEHPSSGTHGAREVAAKALHRIHGMGVLHGDIRRENILVSKKDEGWQVWLLDFGHSSRSRDTEAQALELEELMRLFRKSSDSGASEATKQEA